MSQMIKFPSIRQFRDVIKSVGMIARSSAVGENGQVAFNRGAKLPKLSFTGTVKMHGTNAAIVISPSKLHFQSRERVLAADEDNAGFFEAMQGPSLYLAAKTVASRIHDQRYPNVAEENTVAIFGEWCGGNIQKGVALAELKKMFVIFAVKFNDEFLDMKDYDWIGEVFNHHVGSLVRMAMDFKQIHLEIDFERPELSQSYLAQLTQEVEERCPVAEAYGVNGIGEGIVWTCDSNQSPDLWFKVKGEKHSVTKVKTLAAVDVEKAASLHDFVASVCSEQRFEQSLKHMVNEALLAFEEANVGHFIRWVVRDIIKEESDVIEASGLTQKEIGGPVSTAAKRWFFGQLDKAV